MYIKIMKCIQLNSVHWHHHVGIQSNEIKYDTCTIMFSIFMVEHNFFKSGGLSQPCQGTSPFFRQHPLCTGDIDTGKCLDVEDILRIVLRFTKYKSNIQTLRNVNPIC